MVCCFPENCSSYIDFYKSKRCELPSPKVISVHLTPKIVSCSLDESTLEKSATGNVAHANRE